ncbi:hypothetical protein Rctr197k_134 [Virus Rctr197k]|nr:hypothetical protein Rctr197k_134 [Virus Rctr197k]
MARRQIGDAVIYIRLMEHDVFYCTISVKRQHCYTCEVRPPPSSGHFNDLGFGRGVALDAPEAFDQVAETAVAFGSDDNRDDNNAYLAGIIRDATDWAIMPVGTGYQVRRPRRRKNGAEVEARRTLS